MIERWRLLDTGLASAARNIALNRALLEARHANESPSTLRFLRFSPCTLVGSRQSAGEELAAAFCSAQALPVQRRITSGGTWLVDERQLGWELYLHRREVGNASMPALTRRIGHAAAAALSALGVDARFRARDEIEIEGRVVCMLAHAAEGGAVLCQAVLLADPDLECLVRAVRFAGSRELESSASPQPEEVARVSAALGLRLTGLKQVLGRAPDLNEVRRNLAEAFESEFEVEFAEGDLNLSEHERYLQAANEMDAAWAGLVSRPASGMPLLEALHRFRGGVLRVQLKYEISSRTIRQVWFSGDIAWNPRRSLFDFEAALRDVSIDQFERVVQSFFASHAVDRGPLELRDLIDAVRLAAHQRLTA